eukprot:Blabericola_migrator_1__6406@NODE_322_length_9825_cov_103_602685_g259_i1_p3_GENE_NODE_322_length_9825_cov_103_602685_g259_i1NODE_322_length_9825_cov_103_602685_g259_i1_p3_ORF_typecomplete_len397_score18_95Cyclin/PF08613_11/1_3e34Cyclin_N/PF00134_23/6_7e08_NODE_322_length_9825_cov_103_602685_g259_i124823672
MFVPSDSATGINFPQPSRPGQFMPTGQKTHRPQQANNHHLLNSQNKKQVISFSSVTERYRSHLVHEASPLSARMIATGSPLASGVHTRGSGTWTTQSSAITSPIDPYYPSPAVPITVISPVAGQPLRPQGTESGSSNSTPPGNKETPTNFPDPVIEARRQFAHELQKRLLYRVNPLLPDSMSEAERCGDRGDSDMSAYNAIAHPATIAYVEAMGTLLHKIINISYPRHRYEKQFRFDAVTVPLVGIGEYLERLRSFFLCSPECFVLAMIYMDRLVRLYDGKVVLCSLNIHRILVTAVMVAAKFFDDVYYSNSFYAKVGGLSLEEMNVLESHFLHLIKYDLYVSPREYERYRHNVSLLHASCNSRGDLTTPSTPPTSPAANRDQHRGKRLPTYVATS